MALLFKIAGKLVVQYSSIMAHLQERSAEEFMSGGLMIFMHFFFLIFFIKVYVVGTHLNCLDLFKAIQMSTNKIIMVL